MLSKSSTPLPKLDLLFSLPSGLTQIPYMESSRRSFSRDLQELIDVLSARVQKDRSALEEYILLGRLFRIRGEPSRALRLHKNLLARPTMDREVELALYTELGIDMLEMRLQDYGERYFFKAIHLRKQHLPALEGLIRAYELQGNFEQAAEILSKLIKLGRPEKQHLAFVLAERSLQLLRQGGVAKARRTIDRAIRADESCPYAQLVLADVYVAAGRHDRALEVLKAFVARWPTHSFLALRQMEDAHYRMNRFPAFQETLRQCIHVAPDNFYLLYSLARHLRKLKKPKEALEYLRRAFEANPLYVNAVRDRIEMLAGGDNAAQLVNTANVFFSAFKRSRRFICPNCRHRTIPPTWYCAKCGSWGIFDIRYELLAP